VRIRSVCTGRSSYGSPTFHSARIVGRDSARASIPAFTSSKEATFGGANGENAWSTCATPSTISPVSSTPK
jgi:hypothetical protein